MVRGLVALRSSYFTTIMNILNALLVKHFEIHIREINFSLSKFLSADIVPTFFLKGSILGCLYF